MKILWLSTGTINCDPIINSLDSIKKPNWEIKVFDYSKDPHFNDVINEWKPDKIFVIGSVGIPIKVIIKICPIYFFCFDGSCPDWHPIIQHYKQQYFFMRFINIDGNSNWPSEQADITTLAPIDQRAYENKQKKDIQCGFAGGWESPGRYDLFKFLKESGLITIRSFIDSFFTYSEYATFMNRCNIIVNANESGGGAQQVKARVIETGLAGAALLEPKGSITSRWFKPGLDYLEYESKEDAADKIKWLMNNYIELGKYQSNLAYKVRADYSPAKFWEKIL